MIKLTQISQYIMKKITPAKKAMTDVIASNSTLERIPAQDSFEMAKNILTESPKKLIKKIISEQKSSNGKDASVFMIPNQPNYVLRVEQTAIPKLDELSENMRLIPINHSPSIANNENLGLPLYSVVGETSPLYNRKSITPIEALTQKDNITILRKVTGKHPARETNEALKDLIGCRDNAPNIKKYLNISQLMYIRDTYGAKAAQRCMQEFEKGGEITIPENFFEKGSQAFTFTNSEQIISDHRNFVNAYLKELKEIADMPQDAFKKAVDTILADKNFLVDFQHTNNTFVDIKNKQFNFMDFEYDKSNAKYIYKNPIYEFRNVILGKHFCDPNFCCGITSPVKLIFDEKDVKPCKELINQISKKVNDASPDKFKFLN